MSASRRKRILARATPRWSSARERYRIENYAAELREQGLDVQVDHIYPLQGTDVCGLNCEFNLQVVFARDNSAKGTQLLAIRTFPLPATPLQGELF